MSALLDFSEIKFASASYLKAVVLGLAREEIGLKRGNHFVVFPVIQNISSEIVQELGIVCESERFPCLEATTVTLDRIVESKLHGKIDKTLARTARTLQRLKRGTASEVSERSPDEGINITAWNNRLAELFRVRIAIEI